MNISLEGVCLINESELFFEGSYMCVLVGCALTALAVKTLTSKQGGTEAKKPVTSTKAKKPVTSTKAKKPVTSTKAKKPVTSTKAKKPVTSTKANHCQYGVYGDSNSSNHSLDRGYTRGEFDIPSFQMFLDSSIKCSTVSDQSSSKDRVYQAVQWRFSCLVENLCDRLKDSDCEPQCLGSKGLFSQYITKKYLYAGDDDS